MAEVGMAAVTYHDLAQFGMPLVTPDDFAFPALVAAIRNRLIPFGLPAADDLETAAGRP